MPCTLQIAIEDMGAVLHQHHNKLQIMKKVSFDIVQKAFDLDTEGNYLLYPALFLM